MTAFNHTGPRTYVYKISGKNVGRVGYVRGSFADRVAMADTRPKAFVYFPQLPFPDDFVTAKLTTLREATPLQVIMEGFEPC